MKNLRSIAVTTALAIVATSLMPLSSEWLAEEAAPGEGGAS